MPNLSTTHFNNAQRNRVNANLKASEEMQLVSGSTIVADPSALMRLGWTPRHGTAAGLEALARISSRAAGSGHIGPESG